MRQNIVAGNWKMNLTRSQAMDLVQELLHAHPALSGHQQVILCPPFPYLERIAELTAALPGFHVGAQNCHQEASGAFTGEVSASMLASVGVRYVILGHSERREYYSESPKLLARKTKEALKEGLIPIFCCGEPLEIREAGTQNAFVEQQLKESLYDLDEASFGRIVLAYEPIWAIGTGLTASPEQAQDMHAFIRSSITARYGSNLANNCSILYGGSCKASNARELMSQPDVDGGLIGGASLKASEFLAIIAALNAA